MASSSGAFWTKNVFDLSLGRTMARFQSWYRDEFFTFLSPQTRAWLLDRGERKLVLSSLSGAPEFRLVDDGRGALLVPIAPDELLASSLGEALARRGLTRATTRIALQLPPEAFFVRRFDVPQAALPTLPRLLNAEIERKTPFRAADVVFGVVTSQKPDVPDKIHVEQWILRRDLIEHALKGAGIEVADLDVVEPQWPDGAATKAPSIVVGGRLESSNWFRNALIGLWALAALLFCAGIAASVWRQDRIGAELDAQIVDMSARATRVRQMADRATAESRLLATLRQERQRFPALADLWEEVSGLLPDGAYVIELRLSEGRAGERLLDLTGFAESAVGLPALFDRSPLFSDAALTSAITPDLREKREAFSLQAKVRQAKESAQK